MNCDRRERNHMQSSSSNAAQLICHIKESGAQGSGGPQDRHLGESNCSPRKDLALLLSRCCPETTVPVS